jgi:hypothetical protein
MALSVTSKAWLHSLAAAAIGGAASALGAVIISPDSFNWATTGFAKLGEVALVGAIVPVLALLKQSPLPTSTGDTTDGTTHLGLGILLILGLAMVPLAGCDSFERTTFNSLAASKAVIDTAQKDYTAGTIKQTTCTYAVINDAKAAQTVAVNSMLVYETAKTSGNEASVELAVADIIPIIAEVKTLYTNPAGCSTGAYK